MTVIQKFRLGILSLIVLETLFLLSPQPVRAQNFCANPGLDRLPVLTRGRVKPLVVHAIEAFKMIKVKVKRSIATETFCKLSFNLPYKIAVGIEHVELRKILGLPEGQKTVSMDVLQEKQTKLMGIYHQLAAKKEEKSSFGKALNHVLISLQTYQAIIDGRDWTIAIDQKGTENDWMSLTDFRAEKFIGTPENTIVAIIEAGNTYLRTVKSTVALEYTYHKLNLISYKVLIALLGLIVVFSVQKKSLKTQFRVGGGAIAIVLAVNILDLFFRVIISGRGPVTNMYETVLWVGTGVALFAGILGFLKRKPVYFLFGLLGALLTSFMNRFAPSMVDPAINPLVPVLRDNFWLSTHVTCVTISYAAFALSWLIATYTMIDTLIRGPNKEKTQEMGDLAYAAVKIGVVLLAAGVILGGVWADYSWGRFWGWDPKETWSLIALLIYVAILHGRYAGWIKPKTFLPSLSLAFLSILMCWFGVNYILASGLHSYGFSENGAIFLGTFFGLQFLLFGIFMVRNALKAA